ATPQPATTQQTSTAPTPTSHRNPDSRSSDPTRGQPPQATGRVQGRPRRPDTADSHTGNGQHPNRRPVTGVTGSRGVRASSGLGVGVGFGHGNSPRFLGGVTVCLTGYRLFGYRVTVTGHDQTAFPWRSNWCSGCARFIPTPRRRRNSLTLIPGSYTARARSSSSSSDTRWRDLSGVPFDAPAVPSVSAAGSGSVAGAGGSTAGAEGEAGPGTSAAAAGVWAATRSRCTPSSASVRAPSFSGLASRT